MTSEDNTLLAPAAGGDPYTFEKLKAHVVGRFNPDQLLRLKGLIEVELNHRMASKIEEAKKSSWRVRRGGDE